MAGIATAVQADESKDPATLLAAVAALRCLVEKLEALQIDNGGAAG